MSKRAIDDIHVAPVVRYLLQHTADPVDEIGVPLAVESGPSGPGWCRDPGIVTEIFGDTDLPRLPGVDGVVDGLDEEPSVGQVLVGAQRPVDAPDVLRGIEAEA